MKSNRLFREWREALDITISVSIDDVEVAPFDVTKLPHALQKSVNENLGTRLSTARKPNNEGSFHRDLCAD
jgi:hypothetical protein